MPPDAPENLLPQVSRRALLQAGANIVVPGSIMTNRMHALNEAKARRENRPVEDVVRESTDAIPVGRHGRPDEYADVVTFLASPHAGYVTGSVVRIDGGMIANV